MRWFLQNIGAGVIRWAIGIVIGAACLMLGFVPETFVAGIISEPPVWLSHWLARLGLVVIAGSVIVGTFFWDRRERYKAKRVPPLTSHDCEVYIALFLILDSSAWMRWQDAQHIANSGKPLGELNKMHLAETVFRMRAENGEIIIRGRRRDRLEYEEISPDIWKITYLDLQHDKKTLWRATMKARHGLDQETAKQIPDYVSLQVSEQKVREFWPKKDKTLDAKTMRLLQNNEATKRC